MKVAVTVGTAILLLLGGCTADDDSPAPTPTHAAPTAVAESGLVRVRSVAWQGATVDKDGRSIRVDYVGGVDGCGVLSKIDVRELADSVVVTVMLGDRPSVTQCRDVGITAVGGIALSSPLGDRSVKDGHDLTADREVVRL